MIFGDVSVFGKLLLEVLGPGNVMRSLVRLYFPFTFLLMPGSRPSQLLIATPAVKFSPRPWL